MSLYFLSEKRYLYVASHLSPDSLRLFIYNVTPLIIADGRESFLSVFLNGNGSNYSTTVAV